MASIFKPKGSKKYVILYSDENGRRRKKTGATDKTVTKQIARDLENKVALRRSGIVDAKDEAYRDHEAKPLADHLDDWHKDMLARDKTLKHANQYRDRAGKVLALTKGVSLDDLESGRSVKSLTRTSELLSTTLRRARFSDLNSEAIQSALAMLNERGKSNQTTNHFRAAIRAFLRWSYDRKRIREIPMQGVESFNVEEDQHVRRALTDDELSRLIHSTVKGPVRFEMSGPLRAMAYRVASATGFRVQELRSLMTESFRLDRPDPSIFLRASSTKNRRSADQPISQSLARDLRIWLKDKTKGKAVFPLHHETAKAIRADLEAIGVDYETEEGTADFHSLRAYYVSALIRSGASISEFQRLARHAKPETTLKHYAKLAPHNLRSAVEALPTLSPDAPDQQRLAATGTDSVSTATQNATVNDTNAVQLLFSKRVMSTPQRFAKPLNWETGFGGSNPPLSV